MAKGLSLHVGLNTIDPNHYAGWDGRLNACEADAQDTAALAEAVGFEPTVLLGPAGTRRAVLDWLEAAAGSLSAGDMFLLVYSGHGSQLPDPTEEEPDHLDETWCLYDGQVVDDELYRAYSRFAAGVRGLVLSDSCHSGSVVKFKFYDALKTRARELEVEDADYGYKFTPQDVALRTYQVNKGFYDGLLKGLKGDANLQPKATVRLISGCQDNQYSQDGPFNSKFTAALRRTWADGAFRGDYAGFHQAIQQELPPTQSPNHMVVGPPNPAYDAQKPFTI